MSQWEIITDRRSPPQNWALGGLGRSWLGERLSGNTWIYFDVAQPSIFGYSSENKNISSGITFHTFVPFSMLVGFEIIKSTNEREKKYGEQDYNKYDYRDHVSTVADIYISACSPSYSTGSDQPSPLKKLKESLK